MCVTVGNVPIIKPICKWKWSTDTANMECTVYTKDICILLTTPTNQSYKSKRIYYKIK